MLPASIIALAEVRRTPMLFSAAPMLACSSLEHHPFRSRPRVDEVALTFHEFYYLGSRVVAHERYEVVNVSYALYAHLA
jgi:hypothetical protein